MGCVLLLGTLALEVAGMVWSYWFGVHVMGPKEVAMLQILVPRWHITTVSVGLFWLALNVMLHLMMIVAATRKSLTLRARLGRPGLREQEIVTQVYEQLAQSSNASPIKRLRWPRSLRYQPGRSAQIRWLGRRLVIDEGLFKSSLLAPLLAQQLAAYNSADLWIRMVLACLPPPFLTLGVIAGVGVGIGPFVTFLLWPWYWRRRVFAGDRFAAHLGQGPRLIEALDRLVRVREKAQNVFVREAPYATERIDRLMRVRDVMSAPGSVLQQKTVPRP